MKTTCLFLSVILLISCNNSQKDSPTTIESDQQIDTPKTESNQQDGDYNRLYEPSAACKLSIAEVATTFALSTAQISTNIEQVSPCLFNITYRDGSKGIFSIRVIKTPQQTVQKEIESALANETQKKLITPSSSGGHYIYKHPNQGYLLLSHPKYDNRIKIQYMVMVASDLTQTQKEYVENKAYQTAQYLITKYKD